MRVGTLSASRLMESARAARCGQLLLLSCLRSCLLRYFHPLLDPSLEGLRLGLREFLEGVEALLPQLDDLFAELRGILVFSQPERLLQGFQSGLVLTVPCFLVF